jgi:hypothetical protein
MMIDLPSGRGDGTEVAARNWEGDLDELIVLLTPIESVRPVGFCCCSGTRKAQISTARDRVLRDADYLRGREPAMRMSTSLLALCCQSVPEPTCDAPINTPLD